MVLSTLIVLSFYLVIAFLLYVFDAVTLSDANAGVLDRMVLCPLILDSINQSTRNF